MRLSKNVVSKIKDARKRGFSIPEISREMRVPKSTVFRHIKGTKISPKYINRWLERRNASKIMSERQWNLAHKKACQLLDAIGERDLILLAVALYWAEGAKRDFAFSNTDAEMIKVFVHALRRVFLVKNEDIKVSLRLYEDLNQKTCLHYWSKILGIKLAPDTSVNILKGSKNGKLKYGMCRIRVKKSGPLLKDFFAIIKRIFYLINPS